MSDQSVDKVVIHFRPAGGNAPLLKQSKFKLSPSNTVSSIRDFLCRQLHFSQASHPSLFVYVNGAFAPTPDQLVGDLHRCFAVDGVLVLNYSTTPAWG